MVTWSRHHHLTQSQPTWRPQLRLYCESQETPSTSWDPYMAPKLDFDEDYYSVLEADPACNMQELKKAYYKMVFKYHPDNKERKEDKELANKQMMVINGAYRILKDSLTRTAYDKMRAKGLVGAQAGIKGSGTNDPKYRRPSSPSPSSPPPSSSSRVNESPEDRFWDRVAHDPDFANRVRDDYIHAKEGDHWEGTDVKKVSGRGDGSVTALKLYLRSIKHERMRRIHDLEQDRRDWGAVKDINLINQRLHDLQEVKRLEHIISDLEDEIENLIYPQSLYDEDNPDDVRHYEKDDPYDGKAYEERDWSQPPDPMTQPQRQRDGGDSNRRYTTTWSEEDDRSERRWRDYQRKHPPHMSTNESRGARGSTRTESAEEAADFLQQVYKALNTKDGSSARNASKSREQDGIRDLDDLLSSADEFHDLADRYSRFDASKGGLPPKDEPISLDKELFNFLRYVLKDPDNKS
eukprot:scaffold601_cov170-Ochromonas_danica.AAC.25